MAGLNMRRRKSECVALLVVGSLSSAGCVGGVASNPAFQAFADPLHRLTIPATNESKLTYSNDDAFDFALHASMKGNTPVIAVSMPSSGSPILLSEIQNASSANPGDERINRWMLSISNSKGSILACENKPEFGFWPFIALLANIFMPLLNDYVTYKPATKYNSVIFYDEATKVVSRVKMLNRSSVDAAALTCEAADKL